MQRITLEGVKKLSESGTEGKLMVNTILHAAFALVENPRNWKAPINKTLSMDHSDFEKEVIQYAVSYMTATECSAIPLCENNEVLFRSIGYQAGPAGDH